MTGVPNIYGFSTGLLTNFADIKGFPTGSTGTTPSFIFPGSIWSSSGDTVGTVTVSQSGTHLLFNSTAGTVRGSTGYKVGVDSLGWFMYTMGQPISNTTYSGWAASDFVMSSSVGSPGAGGATAGEVWTYEATSTSSNFFHSGSSFTYGSAATINSTITHIIHLPTGKIFLAINGVLQNNANLGLLTGAAGAFKIDTFVYPVMGQATLVANAEFTFSFWRIT